MLFYTVAPSGERWTIITNNAAYGNYIAQVKMQNNLKSKAQASLISS